MCGGVGKASNDAFCVIKKITSKAKTSGTAKF